jgi:hypothetical protein
MLQTPQLYCNPSKSRTAAAYTSIQERGKPSRTCSKDLSGSDRRLWTASRSTRHWKGPARPSCPACPVAVLLLTRPHRTRTLHPGRDRPVGRHKHGMGLAAVPPFPSVAKLVLKNMHQ